jgi:hypothetical protein
MGGTGTVKLSDMWLGGCSKGGYPRRMTTPQDPIYAGYRYPPDLIRYDKSPVWPSATYHIEERF